MAGTTNFVQVNPTAANQMNDATYDSNTLTTNGIGVDAILPSPWLNKVWFQASTFITALAAVIAGWGTGYTITDASISALQTQLTNFFTLVASGLAGWTKGSNSNGYWEISPTGRITQWGNNAATTGVITFPIPFTTLASINVEVTTTPSGSAGFVSVDQPSTTINNFTPVCNNPSSTNCNWFATGY